MKILSALLSVLAAGPVNDRLVVQKSCQITCSGEADNFSQYDTSKNIIRLEGMYALHFMGFSLWSYSVNLEHCRLRTVENISTWMSCNTQCLNILGIQNIYSPGPKRFTIYPNRETQELTVAKAIEIGLKVHYQVTGEC